jgi:3'-5' exoribonuclease
LAESLIAVYPFIDRDLLLSGAILHDVCKTEELEANESGISTGYTFEGNLLGHLTKGAILVDKTAEKLGLKGESVTLLTHMMISHHGIPEYGSAVMPQFLEAILLNMLDNIEKVLRGIDKLIDSIGGLNGVISALGVIGTKVFHD